MQGGETAVVAIRYSQVTVTSSPQTAEDRQPIGARTILTGFPDLAT
jgi:hypothetical protein